MKHAYRPARLLCGALAAPLLLTGALTGPWPAPAAPAATVGTCQSWTFGQPPSPGSMDNELNGVSVLSPCDAWAVGEFRGGGGANQTLIEHWDGTSWTVVPSPSPGTNGNGLTSVRAVSATDVWAVGTLDTGSLDKTLILHFDGTAWTQVPSPSPGNSDNTLSAVTATSATNAWAAGAYQNDFRGAQTLVLHWNGTKWARVTSPDPGSFNDLAGLTATSASDAWAAGEFSNGAGDQTLLVHWNGTKWARVPSPSPGLGDLTGVAATSPGNAWAVGFFSSNPARAIALHWNGTTWATVTLPGPANPEASTLLTGVTATSASNALAVGNTETSTTEQSLILHWTGTGWIQVPAPSPPTSTALSALSAVAATSAGNAWAAGTFSTTTASQALAIHCC